MRREPHHDVVMVTGYDEAVSIYDDTDTSRRARGDRTVPRLPGAARGQRRRHRAHRAAPRRAALQRPAHHDGSARCTPTTAALLMRLITPKRLKENEEFMWPHRRPSSSTRPRGRRRAASSSRTSPAPFTLLVIADLLGVPRGGPRRSSAKRCCSKAGHRRQHQGRGHDRTSPLEYLYDRFTAYIEDRRRDTAGRRAHARWPRRPSRTVRMPEVIDVVRVAANLFTAGQETTVRLLSSAVKMIGRGPRAAAQLRARPRSDRRTSSRSACASRAR